MIQIGPYTLGSRAVLAPMAGVTDLPFRRQCKRFGAGLTASEMVIGNPQLWDSRKTRLRLMWDDSETPRVVQIAGNEPGVMAEAARHYTELGAQIIDINMGCPAKKVCRRAAGSALLREPALVKDILLAVIAAVDVPVTLKIRTGWSTELRNGLDIARLAEDCGIAALAVHGRTRACRFNGSAEYDTIAAIVQKLSIPVFANGDITSAEQAAGVLAYTGAAGVMIGRGAQGRPWIFREISETLQHGCITTPISNAEVERTLLSHLQELHQFYGETQGVRVARKHIGWYLQDSADAAGFRRDFNQLTGADDQLEALHRHFATRTDNRQEELAA